MSLWRYTSLWRRCDAVVTSPGHFLGFSKKEILFTSFSLESEISYLKLLSILSSEHVFPHWKENSRCPFLRAPVFKRRFESAVFELFLHVNSERGIVSLVGSSRGNDNGSWKKTELCDCPPRPPALQSNCLQWDGYRLLRNQILLTQKQCKRDSWPWEQKKYKANQGNVCKLYGSGQRRD